MRLRINAHVGLKANRAEEMPYQEGTIIDITRRHGRLRGRPCYVRYVTIELDDKYREGRHDDGLREVTADQIVPRKEKLAPKTVCVICRHHRQPKIFTVLKSFMPGLRCSHCGHEVAYVSL